MVKVTLQQLEESTRVYMCRVSRTSMYAMIQDNGAVTPSFVIQVEGQFHLTESDLTIIETKPKLHELQGVEPKMLIRIT